MLYECRRCKKARYVREHAIKNDEGDKHSTVYVRNGAKMAKKKDIRKGNLSKRINNG